MGSSLSPHSIRAFRSGPRLSTRILKISVSFLLLLLQPLSTSRTTWPSDALFVRYLYEPASSSARRRLHPTAPPTSSQVKLHICFRAHPPIFQYSHPGSESALHEHQTIINAAVYSTTCENPGMFSSWSTISVVGCLVASIQPLVDISCPSFLSL